MMTRRSLIAAMAAGVLMTTGCSGGLFSKGPADGYTREEVGHLILERPSGWQESTPSGEKWTKAWSGDGMEMQVAGEFSEDVGAQSTLARLDLPATMGLKGYTPEGTDTIKVDGAYDAIRRYYSFDADGKRQEGVWIVATQFPYPSTGVISISGENLDETVVRQVTDSLKWKEYHD